MIETLNLNNLNKDENKSNYSLRKRIIQYYGPGVWKNSANQTLKKLSNEGNIIMKLIDFGDFKKWTYFLVQYGHTHELYRAEKLEGDEE